MTAQGPTGRQSRESPAWAGAREVGSLLCQWSPSVQYCLLASILAQRLGPQWPALWGHGTVPHLALPAAAFLPS